MPFGATRRNGASSARAKQPRLGVAISACIFGAMKLPSERILIGGARHRQAIADGGMAVGDRHHGFDPLGQAILRQRTQDFAPAAFRAGDGAADDAGGRDVDQHVGRSNAGPPCLGDIQAQVERRATRRAGRIRPGDAVDDPADR